MSIDGGQSDDGTGEGSFAWPPCFMHEIDPGYGRIVDPTQTRDVARWRKAERERLIAARLALSFDERASHAGRLAADLDAVITKSMPRSVSLFWPFRGEPDLRPWMQSAHDKGIRIALPVVVAKGQPLVFREWWPGVPLAHWVWNIPCPADRPAIVPDVVIAPLVGFDPAGFRLGYGVGFFDRTLAAATARPIAIGVGHPIGAVATIYPQPHDIAMDCILVGDGRPRSCTDRSRIL